MDTMTTPQTNVDNKMLEQEQGYLRNEQNRSFFAKNRIKKTLVMVLIIACGVWAQETQSGNEQQIVTLLIKDNLIIYLFPLLGVLFSAILSFVISKHQSNIELEKISSKFSIQLYSKRMETYLEIYELIREFFKTIKRTKTSYNELNDFYEKYSTLESKSSLFFNLYTVKSSANLMDCIEEIVKSEEASDVLNNNSKKKLIKNLIDFEITLRYELGVLEYKKPSGKESREFKLWEKELESLLKLYH